MKNETNLKTQEEVRTRLMRFYTNHDALDKFMVDIKELYVSEVLDCDTSIKDEVHSNFNAILLNEANKVVTEESLESGSGYTTCILLSIYNQYIKLIDEEYSEFNFN